jgi:hypothetical protein
MAGDTLGLTTSKTLYDLTIGCFEKGGFKIMESGEINGVFHYPLLDYVRSLGMDGRVEKNLGLDAIKEALSENGLVLLSIDLAKTSKNLSGGHLILVHTYKKEQDAFIVHDCAHAIADVGENAVLLAKDMDAISNRKGLILCSA